MSHLHKLHLDLVKSIYIAMTYQATMTLYMVDSDYNFDAKDKVYDFVGKQFDITGFDVKRILKNLKHLMEQPTTLALSVNETIREYGDDIDFLTRVPMQSEVEKHWKMLKDIYIEQVDYINKDIYAKETKQ